MSQSVDFIHGLTHQDLPEPIVDAAIRALIDTLGVAVAGSPDPGCRASSTTMPLNNLGAGSNQPASLWTDGRPVSPAGAALANGHDHRFRRCP